MGFGKKYRKTCQNCGGAQTMQSGYMRPWTCDKCSERIKAFRKGWVRTFSRPCGCQVKEYLAHGTWTFLDYVSTCSDHGPDWDMFRFH
jgi:hypothetical protein